MKKILFLFLVLATGLFGMENTEVEEAQPSVRDKFDKISVINGFGNMEKFLDLGIAEAISIIKNIQVDFEDSAFTLAVEWLSYNVNKLNLDNQNILAQVKQLLLGIRYQDLSPSFIKHVVAKTYRLFAKKLNDKPDAKNQIVKWCNDFYALALASSQAPMSISTYTQAQEFGYEQILSSRASLDQDIQFGAIFDNVENLVGGKKYYSAPMRAAGYTFYVLVELIKDENDQGLPSEKDREVEDDRHLRKPFVFVRCISHILSEILSLYKNELTPEELKEIKSLEVPVVVSMHKLFAKKIFVPMVADNNSFEFTFENIDKCGGFVIPNNAKSWKEALSNPFTSTHLYPGDRIIELMRQNKPVDTLISEINLMKAEGIDSPILASLDDQALQQEEPEAVYSKIYSSMLRDLAPGLIEINDDGSYTMGLHVKISFPSPKTTELPELK